MDGLSLCDPLAVDGPEQSVMNKLFADEEGRTDFYFDFNDLLKILEEIHVESDATSM